MRIARIGLGQAISLAIVITSAFWVALGAWLFHAHVAADHKPAGEAAPNRDGAKRGGLLDAFGGRTEPAAPGVVAPSGPVLPSGPVPAIGPLTIPVAGVAPDKLIDTFEQARAEGARRHDAIDILATEGTPVLAAAAGRVEKLFQSHDGGQTIYVRSPQRRLIYYYAHLASYAPGLREGMQVRRGQPLGTVGHSGNADPLAPHLHFAIWRADAQQPWSQNTAAINPYPFLTGRRTGG